MSTLLIVIVLLILLGGGGGYYGYHRGAYAAGPYGYGLVGLLVLIAIIWLLFGGSRI